MADAPDTPFRATDPENHDLRKEVLLHLRAVPWVSLQNLETAERDQLDRGEIPPRLRGSPAGMTRETFRPGERVFVPSGPGSTPVLRIVLKGAEGCELRTELDSDGAMTSSSKTIRLETGTVFLFNEAAGYQIANSSAETLVILCVREPSCLDDEKVLDLAVRQNSLNGIRDLTNFVLRKEAVRWTACADAGTFFEWVHLGSRPEINPASVAYGLFLDRSLNERMTAAAERISSVGLLHIPHETFFDDEITAWLSEKERNGVDCAVLMSAGIYVEDPFGFEFETLRTVAWMKEKKAALAGHIIHRPDRLPFLHEQFLILDLRAWATANRPAIAFPPPGAAEFPAYEISDRNIHDDYTPFWIRGGAGDERKGRPGFATSALAELLKSGQQVVNLPPALREKKDYLYPRSEDENFERVKGRIAEFSKTSESKVFVFNTEPMVIEDFAFTPDTVICPCSGLKPLALARQFGLLERKTRFLFLENSAEALDFYRRLLACQAYPEVLALQRETLARDERIPATDYDHVASVMGALIAEVFSGSPELFMDCLKYVGRNATFEKVDYLTEPAKIFSYLRKEERTLFWHSNVWEYAPTIYRLGRRGLRRNYLEFVQSLGRFFDTTAFMHKDGFRAVIGKEFSQPRMVLTQGGGRRGPPNPTAYQPVNPDDEVFYRDYFVWGGSRMAPRLPENPT